MKYLEMGGLRAMGESHPSRGAWIEIASASGLSIHVCVAPLTGCVD